MTHYTALRAVSPLHIHLPYVLCSMKVKLRTSSHQLKDWGRYIFIQLCHQGVEYEEHHVCNCVVLYEIRERYHFFFNQTFGPRHKVIEYEDQGCLGMFSPQHECRKKLLKDTKEKTFFNLITRTHATSQQRSRQVGSWLGHFKGLQHIRQW